MSEGKQKITDGTRACWYGGTRDANGFPNGEGKCWPKVKLKLTRKDVQILGDVASNNMCNFSDTS